MLRRILPIFLSLLIIFSFSTISVSALEQGTVFKAALSGEKNAVIGEKYTVNVTFGEFVQEEFLAATCIIDYDASVFEVDSSYLAIIEGETVPDNGKNSETYSIIDPEAGWVFWGHNEVSGNEGKFTINVLNDKDFTSLKANSLSCFVDFKVKNDALSGVSQFKIDTDSELVGVFSESLIESKFGTGSSLSVSVADNIPVYDKIVIAEGSSYERKISEISGVEIITGMMEKTTVSEFIANFANPSEELVVTFNGSEMVESDIVPTNTKLDLVQDGNVIDSVIVVCKGDVDATGTINSTDYLQIKKYFLKEFELSGAFLSASDIDESGEIDATDYLRIKMYFLGTFDIYS